MRSPAPLDASSTATTAPEAVNAVLAGRCCSFVRGGEDDDGVIVAGHRLEVLERVHGHAQSPVRREVARDLLLDRCGGQEHQPSRDVASQGDERNMVGEWHGIPFALTYTADPKRLARESGEMLEQSDIAHYLLSLGLVNPRDVIDEDLTVVDVSRRNCVHLATTRAGLTFVVKQAEARNAHLLAHEAAVLRVLGGVPELADRVPALVRHEPAAALLVMSTPRRGTDWLDHRGRFSRIQARALGRTVAALHQLPAGAVGEPPRGVDRMWTLTLPEPSHDLLLDLSAEAQDVVARVQASRFMCERMDQLRDTAAPDVLVHGDLRWDNCIALAAPGARRRTRVVLVDWECAGPGPAAWDVGSVLAEYLSAWIASIPILESRDPGLYLAHARLPLERMRPATRDFWYVYRLAAAVCPPLQRVIELAAIRLVQTAVERAQGLAAPSAHIVTLLQLAENMLRDPEDAASTLLTLQQ